MKTSKRKPIRWRIGTIAETLTVIQKVEEKERSFCHFPDGNRNAVRIQIDCTTGEPLFNTDGTIQIAAPWLLNDIFKV